MIVDKDIFKPIRTLGFIIMFGGFLSLACLLIQWNDPAFDIGFRVFAILIAIWYLTTGFGIVLKKPWGFRLLNFFLYVMYVGWPLGTLMAKKLFSYIKNNGIRKYFYNQVIEL